jgi:hypothetical protein
MSDTVEPNPNVVVVSAPDQYLDESGVNNTVILALGAEDQIDLASSFYDNGEGSGNTVVLTGDKSDVTIGSDGESLGNDIKLFGYAEGVTEGPYYEGSNDTIEANGKDALIDVSGYNSVVLNGTDNVVTVEPLLRADSYDPFGQNSVVANGAGKETVTGGGADFTFTGNCNQAA